MEIKHKIIILITISLVSCSLPDSNSSNTILDVWVTNSQSAQTPNLWIDDDQVHLTWTEEDGDSTVLFYKQVIDTLQQPRRVAGGENWFVNWADFSGIVSHPTDPSTILTNWLVKRSEGTYDYDILISLSKDHGKTWSKGVILHGDGIAAEHGFVSLAPYDEAHFFATWLDGRHTKTPDPDNAGKHLPMSLRAGLISIADLTISEYLLDSKVCDCCQTASVMTNEGILVAYRDRTDEEIRDITIQQFSPFESKVVFQSEDNWKISGCPVNGPALASRGSWSAMAWYTAADSSSVYMVYGQQAAFNNTIKIDNGNPLGRVDIEILDDKAYISWLELSEQRAEIRLKTIDLSSGSIIADQLITHTSPERRSGFPILKLTKDTAYITYTEVLSADHTTVRLKRVQL